MVNESFLSLACAGLLALFFGMWLCFAGYRFFMLLLPIWGFFFGLAFGAQAVQALFGDAFLATVTSWVVGFIVALVFAVLSYLFYIVAVGLIAGSLAYSLVVTVALALGFSMGWLLWLIGVAFGVVVALFAILTNVQKPIVIFATALMGAAVIVGTFVLMFNPALRVLQNPFRAALDTSWVLWLLAIVLAVLGAITQFRTTSAYTMEVYNRAA